MSSSGAMRHSDIALTGIVVYRVCLEVEYLVASFDDGARNAKLSLQQAEILAKLATIVDDISSSCPDQ